MSAAYGQRARLHMRLHGTAQDNEDEDERRCVLSRWGGSSTVDRDEMNGTCTTNRSGGAPLSLSLGGSCGGRWSCGLMAQHETTKTRKRRMLSRWTAAAECAGADGEDSGQTSVYWTMMSAHR